tara:strand:- start:104 stop:436 length:333 start_codon:yes stop_codon:yes gene_type:complete
MFTGTLSEFVLEIIKEYSLVINIGLCNRSIEKPSESDKPVITFLINLSLVAKLKALKKTSTLVSDSAHSFMLCKVNFKAFLPNELTPIPDEISSSLDPISSLLNITFILP